MASHKLATQLIQDAGLQQELPRSLVKMGEDLLMQIVSDEAMLPTDLERACRASARCRMSVAGELQSCRPTLPAGVYGSDRFSGESRSGTLVQERSRFFLLKRSSSVSNSSSSPRTR